MSRAGSMAGRNAGFGAPGPTLVDGDQPETGVGSGSVHRAHRSPGRDRDKADGSAAFRSGLADVAAALRSGARPEEAWRRGLGLDVDDGVPRLADLVARCGGDRATAGAVHAGARVTVELGAAPAVVLERLVVSLGREADESAQREAALAGPRATARLLAWLPAFGVVLGAGLGVDPVAVLLDGGTGTGLLVASGALTVLGRWWSRRCVAGAELAGRE